MAADLTSGPDDAMPGNPLTSGSVALPRLNLSSWRGLTARHSLGARPLVVRLSAARRRHASVDDPGPLVAHMRSSRNRSFGIVLLIGLLLVHVAGCGASRAAETVEVRSRGGAAADSTAAHDAAIGVLAAFDSLQWESFRAYLADDVTMFFPFPQVASRADGREAVEAVFRQFFDAQRQARTRASRPMVQGISPRDLRVQMGGSHAAVVTFHLGAESPARRSLVFRRAAGGAWEVVHWHASSAPQPPR